MDSADGKGDRVIAREVQHTCNKWTIGADQAVSGQYRLSINCAMKLSL